MTMLLTDYLDSDFGEAFFGEKVPGMRYIWIRILASTIYIVARRILLVQEGRKQEKVRKHAVDKKDVHEYVSTNRKRLLELIRHDIILRQHAHATLHKADLHTEFSADELGAVQLEMDGYTSRPSRMLNQDELFEEVSFKMDCLERLKKEIEAELESIRDAEESALRSKLSDIGEEAEAFLDDEAIDALLCDNDGSQ